VALFLLGVVACSPATATGPERIPAVASTSSGAHHPLTTRTDIQVIDQVLNAVAGGDSQKVRAVIEFFEAECTHQEGLGGPPKCREGEAEGTPVEVLAFTGPEGGHIRKDELGNWTLNASGVYAVYEVNPAAVASEQDYPIGSYVILFVDEADRSATALHLGERGILRVDLLLDTSPESLAPKSSGKPPRYSLSQKAELEV
jgi:hypothetical protein